MELPTFAVVTVLLLLPTRILAQKKISACACEFHGDIVNLESLAWQDGLRPRYSVNSSGYTFAYNPCVPYKTTGCSKDVAASKTSILTKDCVTLGDQASMECTNVDGFNVMKYMRPDDKSFTVSVYVTCNHKLVKPDDALFKLQRGSASPEYVLSHMCGCANACLVTTPATPTDPTTPDPTAPDPTDKEPTDYTNYIIGGSTGAAALVVLVIVVAAIVSRRNPGPDGHPPLLQGDNGGNDAQEGEGVAPGRGNDEGGGYEEIPEVVEDNRRNPVEAVEPHPESGIPVVGFPVPDVPEHRLSPPIAVSEPDPHGQCGV
ncbi:uncharacterized protein LOC5500609 isoform X1 [Nematostella vectensis]|uniref:uncharacterized protein LOC5500609 isoform X1 n=1 Tax=Nematostella vectensis TaxID=45351 RepID=UPI002076DADB|nr:uncharacterized protein LOC5500609 isoform X1 [Nematostella vectensis]